MLIILLIFDTKGKDVVLKGKTKGGVPDWKIKDNVSKTDIVSSGKSCVKDERTGFIS